MSRLQVTCITKNSDYERITHIGGAGWRHSEEEAIRNIENGWSEYHISKNGHDVKVIVSSRNGRKYLKTVNDGDSPDNLLSLPRC